MLHRTLLAITVLWSLPVAAQDPAPSSPSSPAPASPSSPAPASSSHAPSIPPAPACVPSCRDGYTCIGGTCVSACNPACGDGETCVGRGVCQRRDRDERIVVTVPMVAPPAAPPAPPSPSANSTVAAHVNLLGLLQLGPVVALETGRMASLVVRFRALNAGALSYILIADASDGEVLGFSYGAGAALRFYRGPGGTMRGFFVSPGIEYVSTRVEEEESVAYNTQLVVPTFEIGYRWVFGHFLVDVGGGIGYAIVIDRNSEPLREGATLYENDAESQLGGAGTLSVGTFF